MKKEKINTIDAEEIGKNISIMVWKGFISEKEIGNLFKKGIKRMIKYYSKTQGTKCTTKHQ